MSCSSNQCSNFFLCTSVLRPIRTQKSFSAIIVRTVFQITQLIHRFLLLKEEVSHFPPLYRSFFSYLHFLSHIKFNYYNVPFSRNANIFSIASCLVMPSLLAFIAIYSCATPYALQQATKLLYTSPWKWNSFSILA